MNLDQDAIVADAVSAAYREVPPLRLHKWVIALIVVACLVLIGDTIGTTWNAVRLQGVQTCQQRVTQQGRIISQQDRDATSAWINEVGDLLAKPGPGTLAQIRGSVTDFNGSESANNAQRTAAYARKCS
jgi:hypothetical protein